MMKRDWDLLFSEYDLRAGLENQLNQVEDKVRAIDPVRFETSTDDLVSATIASELVIAPIELHEDQLSVSRRDAKVDVSYDRDRAFFGPGPHYVDGLEVTYNLPFSGDPDLFKCKPNRYTYNPPRAVLRPSELTFPYDSANRDVAGTKKSFDDDLTTIKKWLSWQARQIGEYNASLEDRVRSAVIARRAELSKIQSDLEALGIPIRGTEGPAAPSSEPPANPVERRETKRNEARREYDVALSFAGEDREYVEQVAEHLVNLDVTVFYDRYETAKLWGEDLAVHLGNIYSRDSHFVVMFASRHYAEKAWPNHERQHALARHLKGQTGRILPVRIDDSEIPGVPSTVGYLDARAVSPDKLAELIRQKVDAR